jgi:glycosidase
MDPYASATEKTQLADGWFDKHMPDLNQKNLQVANYFIQNNIWWIEEYGIDAFRVDTYAYPDQDFMGYWAKAIFKEYPKFGIFGETWVQGIGVQAFFAKNNVKDSRSYRATKIAGIPKGKPAGSEVTNLPGVTDFQLYYALQEGVTKEMGWTEGIMQVYNTLAVDYLYDNPFKNVVFLDNHDLSRFYSVVKEDLNRYKMGVALQLTTRGIPQWYYGDEVLMKNYASLSGVEAREDFSGGWEGDKINKFDEKNLVGKEAEAFVFVKKLANFRKNSNGLKSGKLMQFVPANGVYTYFRYTETETIMVIINTDKAEQTLDCKHFAERMAGFNSAENVVTGEKLSTISTIKIPANTPFVLKLKI